MIVKITYMDNEDEIKKIASVSNIDDAKVRKMHRRGNYMSMLESFDALRVKFMYDELSEEEARKFIVYIKYFLKNGHSEALRLQCYYLHKKFIQGQGI